MAARLHGLERHGVCLSLSGARTQINLHRIQRTSTLYEQATGRVARRKEIAVLGTRSAPNVIEELRLNRFRFCRALAVSIALLFTGSPHAATPSPPEDEDEIYSALLGWATRLSGYPLPAVKPKVQFVSQEFFNENVCHRKSCYVWGWYPNTGQHIVYVHEAVRALIADASNEMSLLAASIIVHEFTHYLQAANRGFAPYRCEEALRLEREAYGVQAAYMVRYGRYFPVGVSMHNARCEGSASETKGQDPAPPAASPQNE
jgi:hypothetical protein